MIPDYDMSLPQIESSEIGDAGLSWQFALLINIECREESTDLYKRV